LLTNIDMGEILERAQSMKFEQTEAEIAEAIARAQTARQAETDILQYAAASQTQVNGGFEGRHMVSFVRAMAPYAGYTVRQLLHDGKTLEIQLSEKIQRDWPEFGRRSVLRLTVEHVRARRDSSLILMDFESAFIRHLADLASDRWAFDGLYGEARWAFDALLTVHRIRWQDLSGQLLEEDLLPVLSRAGRAQEMDRKEFATLLADPLENRGQVAIGQDRPFDDAEFDRLLVARARPDVMPGSVMTMAGLRLKASEQGDAAQRLPILGR